MHLPFRNLQYAYCFQIGVEILRSYGMGLSSPSPLLTGIKRRREPCGAGFKPMIMLHSFYMNENIDVRLARSPEVSIGKTRDLCLTLQHLMCSTHQHLYHFLFWQMCANIRKALALKCLTAWKKSIIQLFSDCNDHVIHIAVPQSTVTRNTVKTLCKPLGMTTHRHDLTWPRLETINIQQLKFGSRFLDGIALNWNRWFTIPEICKRFQ